MQWLKDFLDNLLKPKPPIKECNCDEEKKVILELKEDVAQLETIIAEKNEMIKEQKIEIEKKDKMIEIQDDEILVLKANIEELKPTGTIALELIKDGKSELKWVDKGMNITEHYKVAEYMQNDGLEYLKLDYQLALATEQLRLKFGSGTNNSSYRSEAYNESIGGATDSQHKLGRANDVKFKTGKPIDWFNYVKANFKELGIGGLGIYNSFIHIDTRNGGKTLTTWDER